MKLGAYVGTLILSSSLLSLNADPVEHVKSWHFTLPHGSLKIELQSSPSGLILGLGRDGQGREAPVQEQAESLAQVLKEMKELGMEPSNIVYIATRMETEDTSRELAYACADSRDWRSAMQNGGRGKETLVVELLNRSGAFIPYIEAFKLYGLEIRVTSVEKVELAPFSRVPPRDAHDRASARLLVPMFAVVSMRPRRIAGPGTPTGTAR